MMPKNDKKALCPVCQKYYFDKEGEYDFCEVCRWCDDPLQRVDPDYAGGYNRISLNEAIAIYKEKGYAFAEGE